MRKFIAEQTDAGERADVFIANQYPQFTRSSLLALFNRNLVQINGESAKAGQKLEAGDKVSIDESLLKSKPPVIKLSTVYEDNNVVVLDKPPGVLTHSKGPLNLEATVASFIAPMVKGFEGTNRDGIVHRLDRDTSGLIVCAKNPSAQQYLQSLFSRRKVKKSYTAIVEGTPATPEAIIDAPIVRNPVKPQTFKVGSGGKTAMTEYKILNAFEKNGKKYSLVELHPQTGRTHQLRVHMAYINHPIIGDRLYGHSGDGLMLHASGLELNLPSGQREKFISPMPKRIKDFLNV